MKDGYYPSVSKRQFLDDRVFSTLTGVGREGPVVGPVWLSRRTSK